MTEFDLSQFNIAKVAVTGTEDGQHGRLVFEDTRGRTLPVVFTLQQLAALSQEIDLLLTGKLIDLRHPELEAPTNVVEWPLVVAEWLELNQLENGAAILSVVPENAAQAFRLGLRPQLFEWLRGQISGCAEG